MRRMRFLSCLIVLVLACVPCYSAARKAEREETPAEKRARLRALWPKPAEVERAAKNVKWQVENSCYCRYKGKTAQFVPADISDISDAERRRGMILGKLITEGPSPDNLPPGTYYVFVRYENDQWQAFFTEKYECVAKSTEVKSDMGNKHKPYFDPEKGNTVIRYWHLSIAW